jgi:hypothetical protein
MYFSFSDIEAIIKRYENPSKNIIIKTTYSIEAINDKGDIGIFCLLKVFDIDSIATQQMFIFIGTDFVHFLKKGENIVSLETKGKISKDDIITAPESVSLDSILLESVFAYLHKEYTLKAQSTQQSLHVTLFNNQKKYKENS